MQVDWFTLTAQVVNLLVLVGLLKHFLYGRIVRAMNEREATIAGRLQDAARGRALAEQEAEAFRARSRELEERREQILARAREEAESHRQQLMEAARLEIERMKMEWLNALERERQESLQSLRENLGRAVFAVAKQGLKELANADLEARIAEVFIGRLQALDAAEREALTAAVRGSNDRIEIRTALPLHSKTREDLSRSLRQQLGDSVDVRFGSDPELICGIELQAQSYRLVWNLNSYLESVEARVFAELNESASKHARVVQS